jgi:thioesterase domain-containing protein
MLAEIGTELSPEDQIDFLESPTVEHLARAVERGSTKGARPALVPLQPDGPGIPFFCIPGADENPYYMLDLAKALGSDRPFIVVRDQRPAEERGVYTVPEHAARFCEAIRSRQPEGPYLLGGHCYGGMLAFEAARQFVAAGQKVSLLVLFEVPTPGYPRVVRQWNRYLKHAAAMGSAIVRGNGREVWAQVRAHAAVLRVLFGYKFRALKRRTIFGAGLRGLIEPRGEFGARNKRAAMAYAPGRLACDVVHFFAADEFHSTRILDDPRLGWREFVDGRFSVRHVPGIADGIFKPPNAAILAAGLREALEAATEPRASAAAAGR